MISMKRPTNWSGELPVVIDVIRHDDLHSVGRETWKLLCAPLPVSIAKNPPSHGQALCDTSFKFPHILKDGLPDLLALFASLVLDVGQF